MTSVDLNHAVPDFHAVATSGREVRLSDYRGQKVLLYFYPKDNTPGCTQEGLDFKAHFEAFNALNCVIFGVSRDSLKVHEGFKCKQAFPFELISDSEETLCALFDVIKMKSMYGKQVRGIERSTFLIDEQGLMIQAWRKVQVKTHVAEVLCFLRQL